MESSFLSKTFFSSLSSTRRERSRSLDSHLTSVCTRCSWCESVLSHSVCSLAFKGRHRISL